jgi:ankyrin repeat protein
MNKQIGISLAVFFLFINGLMHATSKEQQLLDAVKKGNVEQVQQLLDAKADPNKADKEGKTPLWWATHNSNKDIVRMLLNAKANPDVSSKDGITPLFQAVLSKNKDIIQILLAAKADPNIAHKDGRTPLWLAAGDGYKEIVQMLLAVKADPNRADKYGRTPLRMAAKDGHKEIVQMLLIAGANPTMKYSGLTPVDVAKTPEIKKYIEEKIKLTKPLLDGAKKGLIDVMGNALKAGALINMPDEDGNTALHRAIMSNNLDAVKYLLQFAKLINFSLKDKHGYTVVDLAAAGGPEMSEIFIEAGYGKATELEK